jgi:hypothetical protein
VTRHEQAPGATWRRLTSQHFFNNFDIPGISSGALHCLLLSTSICNVNGRAGADLHATI